MKQLIKRALRIGSRINNATENLVIFVKNSKLAQSVDFLWDDDNSELQVPTVRGGDGVGDNLTIQSTSNATKGKIFFGANSAYDEVNDRLGINQTTPTATGHFKGLTSDNSEYSLKADDNSGSSLFSVRNDGRIAGAQIESNNGGSVYLGVSAGSNDDGSSNYNTGIGHSALATNILGANNTAYGRNAMFSTTFGSDNVAVGRNSLYLNTFGNYNLANGTNALFANTSGTYNTAIGSNALYSNTTGYSNVAMGENAGRYIPGGLANQTSNSSIYFGADTKASANGNTNETVIGYDVTGNGSNTVTLGNSSVTDTYLAGNLNTSGGRVKSYTIKTANYTITNSDTEIMHGDTDGGAFTLTLPASPTDGIIFQIKNTGTSGNNLTVDRNGKTIDGQTDDITLIDNEAVELIYTTDGWKIQP